MAALVEMVMLPFESVEVTGIGTAMGVVGRIVTGAGGGVMTILFDAGAGGFETTGIMSVAGRWSVELELGFTAEFIVSAGEASGGGDSVGTILREDVPAGGAFNVCVSVGAVFSSCVTSGCVLNAGVAVDVGPSSGSVDVEVLVRYNAVCNASNA
ncbi:MAG: hypothetical protein Q9175_005841 [Cornicularia normoerica]